MGARPQGNPPPIPPQEFRPLASIPGAVDPEAVATWKAQQDEFVRATAALVDEVTACEAEDIRRLTIERAMRRIEALKLYEPLSEQQKFHAADSRVRLLRGSNRAGKTLSAAVEVARAVTGQDPSKKYPMTDGRWFVVGKDQKHIGQVIYPKLFKARSFKILRDAETGIWRSFRPWVAEDIARAHEAKPAPPLIPKRFILPGGISWENKKENVPSVVRLTTGWELSFFSSLGKPPQGSDIDGAWFDEEIVDCLAGWSEVYDPVRREFRRIDGIAESWHVLSFNPATGGIEPRAALKPFIKRYGEIVRVTLSNGEQIYATRRHKVMATDGRWLSVQNAFVSGVGLHSARVPSVRGTPLTPPPDKSRPVHKSCASRKGERVDRAATDERHSSCVGCGSPPDCEAECLATTATIERSRKTRCASGQESRCRDGRIVGEGGQQEWRGIAPLLADTIQQSTSRVFGDGEQLRREVANTASPTLRGQASRIADVVDRQVCPIEPDGVTMPFCDWQCAQGRSSTPGSQCRCSACCHRGDEHAHLAGVADANGAPSPNDVQESGRPSMRQDGQVPTGRRIHCQSQGDTSVLDHASLGAPVYITDVESVGMFPIWDFTVPGTWNYVNAGICNHNSHWFPEMAARILDRLGRIIWSATPQAGTDQLYELHEQAEREQEQKVEPRTVSEFIVLLDENPHMTEQAKRDFANTLSEEERRVRIGGEFAVSSFKVYPEFSMHIQGVDYRDIPKGWTRFMAVDPGHQICAALFAAVPPPDEGDFIYLFDELYIANCNAAMFASTVKQKTGGDDYHAFVIDAHMGIHTELGVGLTVAQQYTAALKAERVTSRVTGSGFILGSDNVLAGIDAVRSLLRIRPDGTTKLRILRGKLPNLEWELKRYHKKRVNGMVTDMPNQKKNNHLCDSLRYMAMLGPKYVKPLEGKPRASGAAVVLKQKMKKRHEMAGGGAVRLGPGR